MVATTMKLTKCTELLLEGNNKEKVQNRALINKADTISNINMVTLFIYFMMELFYYCNINKMVQDQI